MTITQATNTWSLECCDDEYYPKNQEFYSRLFLNCDTLKRKTNDEKEIVFEKLTNITYKIAGKVIFKAEFLIIIESSIRICIVLNNQFHFGNSNNIGNKDIDHTDLQIGEIVEVTGDLRLNRIFLSIFTFFPDETCLPDVDYKWTSTNYYKIDDDIDFEGNDLSKLTQLDSIDSSSNTLYDAYLMEFKLVDCTPKPFDGRFSGFNGYVNTTCWIDAHNWIRNCEGRIIDGIKKGTWFYYDKTGKNKWVFEYEE